MKQLHKIPTDIKVNADSGQPLRYDPHKGVATSMGDRITPIQRIRSRHRFGTSAKFLRWIRSLWRTL